MRLVPLWNRVAIRRMETVNGLIMAPSVDSHLSLGRGIVDSIGDGVRKIKPGEDVYYTHPHNGPVDMVSLNGQNYILVEESFVVARVVE